MFIIFNILEIDWECCYYEFYGFDYDVYVCVFEKIYEVID